MALPAAKKPLPKLQDPVPGTVSEADNPATDSDVTNEDREPVTTTTDDRLSALEAHFERIADAVYGVNVRPVIPEDDTDENA